MTLSKTNNEIFDNQGYLVVRDLWNPEELYRKVPSKGGQIHYWGKKLNEFTYAGEDTQVNGATGCYNHPQYRNIHSQIRLKLEKIIGKKLYNTYYFDRFYFSNQKLEKHIDRPSCEISLSIHISSNSKTSWPIFVKTPNGDDASINLSAGDAILYKGCEVIHWRNEFDKRNILLHNSIPQKYYHQLFFHYVLSNGNNVHYAFDSVDWELHDLGLCFY